MKGYLSSVFETIEFSQQLIDNSLTRLVMIAPRTLWCQRIKLIKEDNGRMLAKKRK